MNTGKSIVELAEEVMRRAKTAEDFVVDTQQLVMKPDTNNLVFEGQESGLVLSDHAHAQISQWVDIPKKYYDRMLINSPALLAGNVNHWFHNRENTVRRMVRTLDGTARAFLSDRYRRIDNHQILETILPVLLESPDIEIVSCDVTDTRLYVKALFPKIQGEVVEGDVVQSGVVISNSEVGAGKLSVLPLVYRLVCTNGLIRESSSDLGLSQLHLGKRIRGSNSNYQIYRDETIMADDRALMMKLEDSIRAFNSMEVFTDILNSMKASTMGERIVEPVKAVETLGKTLDLSEKERNSFLENLIRDRDYSQYGAMNAVTHIANHTKNYDRATELETLGGRVLDLSKSQWSRVANAA